MRQIRPTSLATGVLRQIYNNRAYIKDIGRGCASLISLWDISYVHERCILQLHLVHVLAIHPKYICAPPHLPVPREKSPRFADFPPKLTIFSVCFQPLDIKIFLKNLISYRVLLKLSPFKILFEKRGNFL